MDFDVAHQTTKLYPLTPLQAEMVACFNLLDDETAEMFMYLLASLVPHGCRKLNNTTKLHLVKTRK